jgi:thiamine-phosphate pyrophosphorylase
MVKLAGLYVLIDPSACRGRDTVEVGRAALAGGAALLQWRDKLRDKGDQLAEARALYELCIGQDAAFIVNDHADLALAVAHERPPTGAIGVHVGQRDLPLAEVRRIVPDYFLVGVSTNNLNEARRAQSEGASYIAVGDIFGTASKAGTRAASPQRLAEVRAAVGLPVFGIGGIDAGNAAQVIAAGADGVAVISAVCSAADPQQAARELVEELRRARGSE